MLHETKTKKKGDGENEPIVIKKYANRRLYNTATSTYVTLDYLSEMVKNGQEFVVYDAKSGEDITHAVLTQIIFDEENKGQNLLPITFLRQLIKFYGDNMQSFVPSYLEMSMNAFSANQEKMRENMRNAFGGTPGYTIFEETVRQNMAMFEQAMKFFSPMTNPMSGFYKPAPHNENHESAEQPARANTEAEEEINVLKAQVEALQAKLDAFEKEDSK